MIISNTRNKRKAQAETKQRMIITSGVSNWTLSRKSQTTDSKMQIK